MDDSEIFSAIDLLDEHYEEVFNEYKKRNEETSMDYRYSRGPYVIGTMINVLLLFSVVLHYVLYKLQLPYEIITLSLISLWSFYLIYKHIAMPELDILGIPEHSEKNNSNDMFPSSATNLQPGKPSHDIYINFIKNNKKIGFILSIVVIVTSLLIYFILGSLFEYVGALFIIVFLVLVVQQIIMSFIFILSLDERDKKLGVELIDLAREMKEDGLIV